MHYYIPQCDFLKVYIRYEIKITHGNLSVFYISVQQYVSLPYKRERYSKYSIGEYCSIYI